MIINRFYTLLAALSIFESVQGGYEEQQDSSLSQVALAVPLYFHSGSYHIYVTVGHPNPQMKLLIVDTGSHLAAFPCEPCKRCGTNHASGKHLFDAKKSTTFDFVECGECVWDGLSKCTNSGQCEYEQKYTEGSSWTAHEARDLMFVGTNDPEESAQLHHQLAVPFVFGCETSETGLFKTQFADGIIGMAMHPNSFLQNLMYHNRIANLAFSMCIDGDSIHNSYYHGAIKKQKREAIYGGMLTLGGADVTDLERFVHHHEPMQFADLQYESGWYTVKVMEVLIVSADGSVTISVVTDKSPNNPFNIGKGTIVDSGTTDTFFPKSLSKQIRQAWEEVVGGLDIKFSNDPVKLTSKQFAQLPSFHLILESDSSHSTGDENVRWIIGPMSYFEPSGGAAIGPDHKWKGTRIFTNRLYLDEQNGAVLGANAMMDHHVLFDNGNHRLGIAPAACSFFDDIYHETVTPN